MSRQQLAQQLLACINEMATLQSNPVLEVIDLSQPVEEFHKYPPGRLQFGDTNWRAYYHCHGDPFRFDGEHGHFHIFHQDQLQRETNRWTHVAALSMDSYGQPRQWFMVNAWVTDEEFKTGNEIVELLEQLDIEQQEKMKLVERWLLLMLKLYQQELDSLLSERQTCLAKLAKNEPSEDVLTNRQHYLLASCDIDLQSKLTASLS